MTRKCFRCGAENLPEAKFCENCGASLDAEMPSGEPTQSLAPRPGSLRDAIPFLTGGVDQAKVRFDGWKQKKTRNETERLREEHFENERQQQVALEESNKKESFSSTVTRILVGLLALALLIYLIIKHPNLPFWMARQMVEEILGEYALPESL